MNDQHEDQPARKRSSRLPVRAPQVNFDEVMGALRERLAAIGRWFL
jgi:hypothetical protein